MNRARALTILRQLRAPLEARGIVHAAVFGSVARDEAGARSDIDIVVTPAKGARLDLIDLGGIQTVLDEAFGFDVDVIVEPVGRRELLAAIERDRANAF
jgi:predicted nucleotidyltransferase